MSTCAHLKHGVAAICQDNFVHPCCAQVHLRSAFHSLLHLPRLRQLMLPAAGRAAAAFTESNVIRIVVLQHTQFGRD